MRTRKFWTLLGVPVALWLLSWGIARPLIEHDLEKAVAEMLGRAEHGEKYAHVTVEALGQTMRLTGTVETDEDRQTLGDLVESGVRTKRFWMIGAGDLNPIAGVKNEVTLKTQQVEAQLVLLLLGGQATLLGQCDPVARRQLLEAARKRYMGVLEEKLVGASDCVPVPAAEMKKTLESLPDAGEGLPQVSFAVPGGEWTRPISAMGGVFPPDLTKPGILPPGSSPENFRATVRQVPALVTEYLMSKTNGYVGLMLLPHEVLEKSRVILRGRIPSTAVEAALLSLLGKKYPGRQLESSGLVKDATLRPIADLGQTGATLPDFPRAQEPGVLSFAALGEAWGTVVSLTPASFPPADAKSLLPKAVSTKATEDLNAFTKIWMDARPPRVAGHLSLLLLTDRVLLRGRVDTLGARDMILDQASKLYKGKNLSHDIRVEPAVEAIGPLDATLEGLPKAENIPAAGAFSITNLGGPWPIPTTVNLAQFPPVDFQLPQGVPPKPVQEDFASFAETLKNQAVDSAPKP